MKQVLLVVILGLSLFLRIYRTSDFLGFWFDQGRDAKVVWDIIAHHRLTLIGPTTGIEGIFLGPFYYYFLTPFYWLGHGDPVYPAIALGVLTTLAVFLVYKIAANFLSSSTGLIAALFYGVSVSIVYYHRWLSNPTPLPFFALLALLLLLRITLGRHRLWDWPALGVVVGICLQCEAASASFFLPTLLLFLVVFRHRAQLTFSKWLLLGLGLGVTLLPQLYFDFRHDHLLLKAFHQFLITDSSFRLSVVDLVTSRLVNYFHYFIGKLYPTELAQILASLGLLLLAFSVRKQLRHHPAFIIITTWWVLPLIMLLFYHGNHGYVWDYYFTGAYPAFFLTVAAILSYAVKSPQRLSNVLAVGLIAIFVWQNAAAHRQFFSAALPAYISLSPIRAAVDWVYTDAGNQPFNVDVYVPPVISHSYDYVFLWRGSQIFHTQPSVSSVPLLYTLLEPDGEHPRLREAWLVRQEGYASLDRSLQFGPVTVQKRLRLTQTH